MAGSHYATFAGVCAPTTAAILPLLFGAIRAAVEAGDDVTS